MKKRTKVIIGIIIVAAIIAGVVWFLRSGGGASGKDVVYVQSVDSLMGKNISGSQNRYMGIVESQETWDIELNENQNVKELLVKVGDEVSVGTPLFEYDQDELQLNLDQAKLELEEIDNEISEYNNQINELNAEKAVAPAEEQFSYTVQIQSIQTSIRKEEYNRKAKNIEVEKLAASVTDATVTSEIDGVIKEINENGETDANGNAKPYISVLTKGDYRVKGVINETNVWMLSEGMSVLMRSRVDNEATWKGTVESVDTENKVSANNNEYYSDSDSEMQSTKYPFYVSLESVDGLMLGQHLYIELDEGQDDAKKGTWLYASYVVLMDDSPYVWIDNGNGKLKKQNIEIGEYDEELDQYEVKSGLNGTDLIAWPQGDFREGLSTTTNQEEETFGVDDSMDGEDMDMEDTEGMEDMEDKDVMEDEKTMDDIDVEGTEPEVSDEVVEESTDDTVTDDEADTQ